MLINIGDMTIVGPRPALWNQYSFHVDTSFGTIAWTLADNQENVTR